MACEQGGKEEGSPELGSTTRKKSRWSDFFLHSFPGAPISSQRRLRHLLRHRLRSSVGGDCRRREERNTAQPPIVRSGKEEGTNLLCLSLNPFFSCAVVGASQNPSHQALLRFKRSREKRRRRMEKENNKRGLIDDASRPTPKQNHQSRALHDAQLLISPRRSSILQVFGIELSISDRQGPKEKENADLSFSLSASRLS